MNFRRERVGLLRTALVIEWATLLLVMGLFFFFLLQVARSQRLILSPLSDLLSLFPGPQKLIQKRYDKLLDYNSSLSRSATDESDLARREYEALNTQLVEELQAFNQASRKILLNSLCSFITLLRDLMLVALQAYSTVKPVSTVLPTGYLLLSCVWSSCVVI